MHLLNQIFPESSHSSQKKGGFAGDSAICLEFKSYRRRHKTICDRFSTVGLLWLSEEFQTVVFADILKAQFNRDADFLVGLRHFAHLIVWSVKVHELSVFQSVLYSSLHPCLQFCQRAGPGQANRHSLLRSCT